MDSRVRRSGNHTLPGPPQVAYACVKTLVPDEAPDMHAFAKQELERLNTVVQPRHSLTTEGE